jgi:peptidoglycan/xylan/chitin deacetylase (PgdA/CDA1 family)
LKIRSRVILAGTDRPIIAARLVGQGSRSARSFFRYGDRLEVVDSVSGRTLASGGSDIWGVWLRARLPECPPAGSLLDLVVDQRARGGVLHVFPSAVRVVDGLRIALTFDDGPVPTGDPSDGIVAGSPTERVLQVLATYRHGPGRGRQGVAAAFFVLTGPDRFLGTVRPKGETVDGGELMSRTAAAGHLLGVHWGGRYLSQNRRHTSAVGGAPYDIDGDGLPDGSNALESDLIECVLRIRETTGQTPEFVRPPLWCYSVRGRPEVEKQVRDTYARLGLRMVLTDARLGDGGYSLIGALSLQNRQLRRSLRRAIGAGQTDLVVTMHDSNPRTARRLRWVLRFCERVLAGTRLGGRRVDPATDVRFVDSAKELAELLRAKENYALPVRAGKSAGAH